MMVLPAPASSASRNRKGNCLSMCSYTAIRWCGRGSICEISVANAGLNMCPKAQPLAFSQRPDDLRRSVKSRTGGSTAVSSAAADRSVALVHAEKLLPRQW